MSHPTDSQLRVHTSHAEAQHAVHQSRMTTILPHKVFSSKCRGCLSWQPSQRCALCPHFVGPTGDPQWNGWARDTVGTQLPKLMTTRVDFASIQPFCEALLLQENNSAVQVMQCAR